LSVHLVSLAPALQDLFTTSADRLARDVGLVRRDRCLTGSVLAQALVFGWAEQPRGGLDDLLAAHPRAGCSVQALHQRLTPAAVTFLEQLLRLALQRSLALAGPRALPLLERFAGVWVEDCTSFALPASCAAAFPGCGGLPGQGQAGIKLAVRYGLDSGALDCQPAAPQRAGDVPLAGRWPDLPPGSLRLADLGFFDAARLGRDSENGVGWVSRLPCQVRVEGPDGRFVPLADWLGRQKGGSVEAWVRVVEYRPLRCRLLCWRCPAAVAARRRRRLERAERKHRRKRRKPLSRRRRVWCAWTVLVTNLPAQRASAEEVWVLYRLRWQIELLFKRWKSGAALGQSRGQKRERVLCEWLAKLLGQVVLNGLTQLEGGPLSRRSRVRALRRVRGWLRHLVEALAHAEAVPAVQGQLEALQRVLQRLPLRPRRRKRPTAFELLQEPSRGGLS
jgi:DDE family transposase